MGFAIPTDYILKAIEKEKRAKYLDLTWELKNVMEHEDDGYAN